MKSLFLNCLVLLCCQLTFAQTQKVILDTDLDSDVDDVGAMAMLHTLARHGRVEILGIMCQAVMTFTPLNVPIHSPPFQGAPYSHRSRKRN